MAFPWNQFVGLTLALSGVALYGYWRKQRDAHCPALDIPSALSCAAHLAAPLCGFRVLDDAWKRIELGEESKSLVADCCAECSKNHCAALEVKNTTCSLWKDDPLIFDFGDGVVTAFRGKRPRPSTCEDMGNKMLGETCYLAQPRCEYCGNNEIVQDWQVCLDNSTGAGACQFPTVTATATYKGVELARSTETRIVENNYYFPRKDINMSLFEEHVGKTYKCTWKGEAYYYNLQMKSVSLADVMWSYEARGIGKCRNVKHCPSGYTCAEIIGHVSFSQPDVNVTVIEGGTSLM